MAVSWRACRAPLARRRIELELVGRTHKAGFAVEPRWWKVEQTFGCLQRYRRLLVDHEGGTGMSRTMTLLATLFMTGISRIGSVDARNAAPHPILGQPRRAAGG